MKAFLEARFDPAHLVEVRCIRAGQVHRMWARLSHVEAIEPKLRRLDAEGWNVFCGVNPRALLRSDEASVTELVAFHVDIDEVPEDGEGPRRFASKSNTEKEGNQPGALPSFLCGFSRVKRGMEASVPEPSVVVSSGRGQHWYWILETPEAVTDANRTHLKGINRGLALAVGGDAACSDLSRVLRVPTFHNHKQLPPAEVRLLSSTGRRYRVEDVEPFAAKTASRNVAVGLPLPNSIPPLSPELESRFKALRRSNGEISRAVRGEVGDGSSDSRYVLVTKLLEHGFSAEEILAIVCSRRWFNRRSKRIRPAADVSRDTRTLLRKQSQQ